MEVHMSIKYVKIETSIEIASDFKGNFTNESVSIVQQILNVHPQLGTEGNYWQYLKINTTHTVAIEPQKTLAGSLKKKKKAHTTMIQ